MAIVVAAGCGGSITASPSPSEAAWHPLNINNETPIAVTLVISGTVVETIAPLTQQAPVSASLPPLPWAIELRSPSGRVLLTDTFTSANYVDAYVGWGSRSDTACGRLDLWIGGQPPSGPGWMPGPSPCN